MRRLILVSLFPALLSAQTPAPQPVPLEDAEGQYLEAWDFREGDEPIAIPAVSAKDRPALKWLVSAAVQDLPANPFSKGSAAWREAESVRSFVQSQADRWAMGLKGLTLSQSGSYLALWRWGQPRVRNGRMDAVLRRQWEDKLLAAQSPGVVRGLALRHALCFALAAGDAERFGQLKERLEGDLPDTFPPFQNAFSLLGAPAPVVHLWKLPGMESVDVSLGRLGGRRVRFEPDPGAGLPELPPDTAWVVPTRDGSQPAASAYLEGPSLAEAEKLAPRLSAAGRTAYLAPVRSVFEEYALMYFPIEILLDPQGLVLSIRMGDAARVPLP